VRSAIEMDKHNTIQYIHDLVHVYLYHLQFVLGNQLFILINLIGADLKL